MNEEELEEKIKDLIKASTNSDFVAIWATANALFYLMEEIGIHTEASSREFMKGLTKTRFMEVNRLLTPEELKKSYAKMRCSMNKLEWHHIMDKQPEHNEEIIHCDRPYQGHYPLGVRQYYQTQTFDEFLATSRRMYFDDPDFYWISAKAFPFPIFKEENKE